MSSPFPDALQRTEKHMCQDISRYFGRLREESQWQDRVSTLELKLVQFDIGLLTLSFYLPQEI